MLHVAIRKRLSERGEPERVIDARFEAPAGITVLFGPSGAGKTTVLRAIAGIITPDEGTIRLATETFFDSGTGVCRSIQRRHTGVVFQSPALFPHLTAAQNVAYAARPRRGRLARTRAHELLAMVSCEHTAARYPRELSGGEQQRVALARALAAEPALLLLDEPLAAVDVATRSRLLDAIVELQRRTSIPFLYVTHSHSEAVRIGDWLVVLHQGQVVQTGLPLAVLNAPLTAPVARVLGTENIFVGTIVDHRPDDGITTVDLGGTRVEVAYNGLSTGSSVTLGIRSEDIIVARERIRGTSARNVIAGTIERILPDVDRTEIVVFAGVPFKVSITAATLRDLALRAGAEVHLLMKARAFHLLG